MALFESYDRRIGQITPVLKKYGMQTLDDSIMGLLKRKVISPDDAYAKAEEKSKFIPFMKNTPADFTEI